MSFRAFLLCVSTYRPKAERVYVLLTLATLFIVAHLGLQVQVGFPNGCFGLGLNFATTRTCVATVNGGLGPIGGVFPSTRIVLYLALLTLITTVFVQASYRDSGLRRWIAVTRLATLVIGAGMIAGMTVSSLNMSGMPGLVYLMTGVVVLALIGVATASAATSPRTQFSLLAAKSLSARMHRREIALLVYLMALTLILVGADYASHGVLAQRPIFPTG